MRTSFINIEPLIFAWSIAIPYYYKEQTSLTNIIMTTNNFNICH